MNSVRTDWHFVTLQPAKTLLIGWMLLLPMAFAGEERNAGKNSEVLGKSPNVVVILADDLGFSDLGCYGGEIETPNLDRLAENGIRFTQFYNTARCWPTRASLLTGYYAQQVLRDTVPGVTSGGQGTRPGWSKLLPEHLETRGYRCYHSGKWHVDGTPLSSGFDRSFEIGGGQNNFFKVDGITEEGKQIPASQEFYVTRAAADHAVRCLQEHQKLYAAQPFFSYVAFTSPHFPLHALPEDIEKYRHRYENGWSETQKKRWERMRRSGIVQTELAAMEEDVGPPYHFPEAIEALGEGEVNRPKKWSELTASQREFQSNKMAIHAAMVDRMDREIGKIVDQLKAMDSLDNTVIFFLSDNGASAEIMVRGDGHDRQAPMGSASSYLCLGPGWSSCANTPFRRHKTWVHEGGISTPLIVHWPIGIGTRNELRKTPGHVIDLVPTIAELAGIDETVLSQSGAAPRLPGQSLVPILKSESKPIERTLWWLHEGNRAIRRGNWKLVAAKGQPWELYDLMEDRAESKTQVQSEPALAEELARLWESMTEEFQHTHEHGVPVKKLILPGEAFAFEGRSAFLLRPEKSLQKTPQPWVFYAPTLPAYPDEHEKWMHEQFLSHGVAIAGVDVGEAYGSPESRKIFDRFYREMTEKKGLSSKPCLLGRSRGGLWALSWACDHPDRFSGLAGIYPVFDFRTYPGLENAAKAYGIDAKELTKRNDELNPIARAGSIAKAKLPVYIIHGDEDQVVPLKENSAALQESFRQMSAGDSIELNVIAGQGHNFWPGFFRCQELVDFVIARSKGE